MNNFNDRFKKKVVKNFFLNFPVFCNIFAFFMHRLTLNIVNKLLKRKSDIFLELGSGDKRGVNGWITLDISRKADLYWDLKNGIPFPDESIKKIYSSHLFEHLSFKEINFLLEECKRVLCNDGLFSICVPNARLYIDIYCGKIENNRSLLEYKPANYNTTSIDLINYIAYMDGHHKYMFDEENLLYIIKSKNFSDVRLRAFDPLLDMKDRDFESIYAEAIK